MLHTKNKPNYAFTLVELIVVIVILAILATIAFLSFSSQSSSARDSTRLSDISSIKKWIEVYNTNAGKYPTPDSVVSVTYSWGTAWSQWKIWDSAFRTINRTLSKKVTDPLTSDEYDYSLAWTKREYQIAINLENPISFSNDILNPFWASKSFALGWTWAFSYIAGNYNWLMLKVQSWSNSFYIPVPTLFSTNPAKLNTMVYDSSFSSGRILLPWANTYASYNPALIYTASWSTLSETDASNIILTIKSAYSGSNITTAQVQQIINATWTWLADFWAGFAKGVLWITLTSSGVNLIISSSTAVAVPAPNFANSWTWVYTMTQTRESYTATTLNNKLYIAWWVIAGVVYGSKNFDEYDPISKTIIAKAPTLNSRLSGWLITLNGKIYNIWWCSWNNVVIAPIEVYDPATNIWTAKASMTTPRWAFAVAIANNKIYVFWWLKAPSNSWANSVEVYDPATDVWTDLWITLPTARHSSNAVTIGNKIYVIWWAASSWLLKKLDIFDITTNTWDTTKASASYSKYQSALFLYNNLIYTAWGYDWTSALSNLEVYNPTTDTWINKTSMNIPRYAIYWWTIVNNKFYVIWWNSGTSQNSIEEYTP